MGFITGNDNKGYFDLLYVVDIEKLAEILTEYSESKIPRLGMLLALNDVNSQMLECNNKNYK